MKFDEDCCDDFLKNCHFSEMFYFLFLCVSCDLWTYFYIPAYCFRVIDFITSCFVSHVLKSFHPYKKICQLNRVFGKFLQFSVSLRQFPINKTNLLSWFTTFFFGGGGDGCSLIQSPSTMQEKKLQQSLIRQEVSEITNWHRYKRLTDRKNIKNIINYSNS